ncbi:MAG: TonB-dependent receptor [Pseudomonadota bacterium]
MTHPKFIKVLTGTVSAFALCASPFASAQDTDDEDTIIVTGSRIATDATTSAASPVQVVGAADVATAGQIDITDLLRETPALQGSLPGSLSTVQGADTEDSDTGLGLLNLRSLGIERTLVLQNGRRHVPGTGGQAAVDVNTIPVALLDRIDVFTGGASSIYGADAVTGVVNFILRDGSDFDGLEFRAQTGITDKGDAEEAFVSVAGGGEFADGRGSAVFGVEYTLNTSVNAGDRDFAGRGFSGLINNNAFTAAAFGVNPNSANVFVPNPTLPVSSEFGNIALEFGDAFTPALIVAGDPNAPVPTLPGTNIPILQVIDNGVLRPFNPGIAFDAFGASGGDGIPTNNPLEIILPEQDRFSFNGLIDYDITETVTAFFEGKFAFTGTTDQDGIPFSDSVPIAVDNPFVPAELQAQFQQILADPDLAGSFGPSVSRDILDLDVFPTEDVDRTTFRFVGGLKGELPDAGLNWEVFANYGRTEIISTNNNTRIEDRFFAAIDAVALSADNIGMFDPSSAETLGIRNGEDIIIDASNPAQIGDIICRSQLDADATPPVQFFPSTPSGAFTFTLGDGQCAPINILGNNTISGAGADFAFLSVQDSTVLTQLQIGATLAGDTANFFELPGGPVGFALGLEYREDTSVFQPDSLRFAPGFTAGAISGGPTLPSPNVNDEFPDQINVFEGYLEAKLPLIADVPFAKLVEISGSARFSDYNTIGQTTAWSVGGRWQPIDALTFRGTYAVAVRAPNIGELFSPAVPAAIGVPADPCDDGNINAGSAFREENCLTFVADGFNSADFLSAFVPGTSSGNPELQEEEATTFTAGFVFEPSGSLSGLRVIADYYNIDIVNAIDSLTGAQIASACVDLPSLDNEFCPLIFRDPTDGFVTGFTAQQINIGALETAGIDWSIRYEFDLPSSGRDLGSLSLGATGTRFLEYSEILDPTAEASLAGIQDPEELIIATAEQDLTFDQLGELGLPRWIVNMNAGWTKGPLSITWVGRLESSQLAPGIDNNEAFDIELENGAPVRVATDSFIDFSQSETGMAFVHDFNVQYEFSDNLSVYGGVNNAFDRAPFIGSLARPVGPRGRFFFLGIQAKL